MKINERLATDLNEVSENVIIPLQKLAFKFGGKVTILNVNRGSNKDVCSNIDLYLKDIKTTYH